MHKQMNPIFAIIAIAVLPSNAFRVALPRVGNARLAMHDPKIVSEETSVAKNRFEKWQTNTHARAFTSS